MARSLPLDTEAEIVELQVARWRQMTIAERLDLVEQLCADVERMAVAGIRSAAPDLDDVGVRRELARRRYGSALADAAYGPAGT